MPSQSGLPGLLSCGQLDEFTSLSLLRDFGIGTSRGAVVDSKAALLAAAADMVGPLVLKTAEDNIAHKTDIGGVVLGIEDDARLAQAYGDLEARLGPRVLVTEMMPPGIDMILGARQDPQFGPVVVVGFGGTFAEVLKDVSFLLPPFDAACARRSIDGLRLRPLLDGVRGRGAGGPGWLLRDGGSLLGDGPRTWM